MSKVRVVESVQEVRAELELSRFPNWDVLLQAYIGINVSRANDWTLSGTVTKRALSWVGCERWIEPQHASRTRGLRITEQRVIAVWTSTGRTGSGFVGAVQRQRKSGVPGNDGVKRPISHHSIYRSRQILAELLSSSKREFINGIGADDVL